MVTPATRSAGRSSTAPGSPASAVERSAGGLAGRGAAGPSGARGPTARPRWARGCRRRVAVRRAMPLPCPARWYRRRAPLPALRPELLELDAHVGSEPIVRAELEEPLVERDDLARRCPTLAKERAQILIRERDARRERDRKSVV